MICITCQKDEQEVTLAKCPICFKMVCLDCGRVEEFFDPEIEQRQRAIAVKRGFDLQEHSLALYARCTKADCTHRPPK